MNRVAEHAVIPIFWMAADCGHPEPADDSTAAWVDWDADHPYSIEGERLCLLSPLPGSFCPACTDQVADVEDLPAGEMVACRLPGGPGPAGQATP